MTAYHAVHSAKRLLEKAGFKQIRERESWSPIVKPGGKYYLTRNSSTIIAFAVGQRWRPGNGVCMVGAHTDSPVLRMKPVSKREADGFLQVGVETYGGGLWRTWFDRDLSIAGRVGIRTAGGSIEQKLVKIDKPLLRIPNLAIHLDRSDSFAPNKETELFPIAGMTAAEVNRKGAAGSTTQQSTAIADLTEAVAPLKVTTERHHPRIVELIAEQAGADASDVTDFEMILYDTQKACIGGLNDEFIFSPRLDNLMMSYCGLEALIKSVSEKAALDNEPSIRLTALFDHEEIGSLSAQGADSNMLPSVIRRLSVLPSSSDSAHSDDSYEKLGEESNTSYEQSLASSFLISADMAHSVNPNYGAKYEAEHRPEMNKGTVLKINANQRYATNSPGIMLLEEAARLANPVALGASTATQGVPLQLFVVRNDSPCGGTIGPMLAAALGARTVDLGNAQLAMHSIRETCGVYDVAHAINLFDSFFRNYAELEKKIIVD